MSSKFKATLDPPVWKEGTGMPRSAAVDIFIRDLENFKALEVYGNDKELIYQALRLSNKLGIYAELAKTEREDLDKFTKYLRECTY